MKFFNILFFVFLSSVYVYSQDIIQVRYPRKGTLNKKLEQKISQFIKNSHNDTTEKKFTFYKIDDKYKDGDNCVAPGNTVYIIYSFRESSKTILVGKINYYPNSDSLEHIQEFKIHSDINIVPKSNLKNQVKRNKGKIKDVRLEYESNELKYSTIFFISRNLMRTMIFDPFTGKLLQLKTEDISFLR